MNIWEHVVYETAPTCYVFALKFLQTTTPAIRYWSHIVQHVSGFAGLLTMRTWEISWSSPAIPYMTEVKGSAGYNSLPENAKSIFAPMCHNCTHVLCFQNAAEATQFSGSRHFQIFLPAPSSGCLFLPTTFRLALVVRLYLPSLVMSWVLLLS